MIRNGNKYTVKQLTKKNHHWAGVEEAIKRRTKAGVKKLKLVELYEVRWKNKPFRFRFSDFDQHKRWFYHGTSLSNIQSILNDGFQIKTAKNGRMLGNGIYATYHTQKGILYGVDNYILSVMVYAPKTYLVNKGQSIDAKFIKSVSNNYHALEVRSESIVIGYEMKNHEICVYDCTRIQPRFIIKLE